MVTIELSKVELRHLRDILSTHAGDACLTLAAWVSLNALLRKVGAEPRTDFGSDPDYQDVEMRLAPLLDSPDPVPGYLVKSGDDYITSYGWTRRRDCAMVCSLEQAEWRRGFELKYGYHRDGIEIVSAEGVIDG